MAEKKPVEKLKGALKEMMADKDYGKVVKAMIGLSVVAALVRVVPLLGWGLAGLLYPTVGLLFIYLGYLMGEKKKASYEEVAMATGKLGLVIGLIVGVISAVLYAIGFSTFGGILTIGGELLGLGGLVVGIYFLIYNLISWTIGGAIGGLIGKFLSSIL